MIKSQQDEQIAILQGEIAILAEEERKLKAQIDTPVGDSLKRSSTTPDPSNPKRQRV